MTKASDKPSVPTTPCQSADPHVQILTFLGGQLPLVRATPIRDEIGRGLFKAGFHRRFSRAEKRAPAHPISRCGVLSRPDPSAPFGLATVTFLYCDLAKTATTSRPCQF